MAKVSRTNEIRFKFFLVEWLKQLKYCKNEITTITNGTEGSFLSLGERLNRFLESANAISDTAFSAIEIISEKEIVRSINRLNELLKKIESLLENSEAGELRQTEKMMDILSSAEKVYKMLVNFSTARKDIDSHINLSFDRNGSIGEKALKALSNDLKGMASTLKSKANHVKKGLDSLCIILDKALHRIFSSEDTPQIRSRMFLLDAVSSLYPLNEKHKRSNDVATGISDRPTEVFDKVNEVFVSLQFHDITSQQLMRIEEEVKKFIGVLEEEIRCEEDCLDSGITRKIYEFCEIQTAHLSIVRDEFDSAVGEIKGNLLQISSNVSKVSSEATAFTDSVSGLLSSVSSFVDDISEKIKPEEHSFKKDIKEIQKEFYDLTNVLGILNSDVRPMLIDIDNFTLDLLEEIRNSAEKINIHKTVSRIINDVIARLKNISEDSVYVMPDEMRSAMPLFQSPDEASNSLQCS